MDYGPNKLFMGPEKFGCVLFKSETNILTNVDSRSVLRLCECAVAGV